MNTWKQKFKNTIYNSIKYGIIQDKLNKICTRMYKTVKKIKGDLIVHGLDDSILLRHKLSSIELKDASRSQLKSKQAFCRN